LRFRSAMMAAARRRATRASVNWTRLIFRYTDPKAREHLAKLQSKTTEVSALYGGVIKSIPPIDWSRWQSVIKTPGVVDTFKGEYDTAMQKVVKLNEQELAAKRSQQEAEIRTVEQKASTSAEFLAELKEEIAWTNHWYERPFDVAKGSRISWNDFAVEHFYPNLKIHRMNRRLFLNQPFQYERPYDKIDQVDLVELRKQLALGNVRAMAVVTPILEAVKDGMNGLLRPFNKKWLRNIDYDDQFKNPTNSLAYRAYALKQILDSGN